MFTGILLPFHIHNSTGRAIDWGLRTYTKYLIINAKLIKVERVDCMSEKNDYDILLEQYLKERRMYQAEDSKHALKESLTDLKIRLEAYNNGNIPDFEKRDDELYNK